MYVDYHSKAWARIGLGADSRFECRADRRRRLRLLIDSITVNPHDYSMSGEYVRFGHATGRRPRRDDEITRHVGDYGGVPFEIANTIATVAAHLATQSPSR